ncbi:flagellar biosynthetic protein FliR [Roseomonas sp. OT10]|uniref:flagellar biosynthetic protein FliR n=1 Tax=Roseomonas cutis TaxID=2897332 RepID=UPI001E4B696E|nr:flagellar biosynthetic protein FliR [Roseomonas sp. OT10]UFN48614.1 flagellar biosynthetic protein FliR [Roseomonas sp. OT10]
MSEAEFLAALPQLAFHAVLLLARLGAAVMLLPGLGEAEVPATLRLSLGLALVPLLLPGLSAELPAAPDAVPAMARLLALEVLTGIWIGGLARIVALALSVGLQAAASLIGLASVLAPDSQMGAQSAALGRLGSLAATVLVLGSGLYALPLQALAESYAVLPAGAPWPAGPAAEAMVAAGSALLEIALRLAAPFVLGALLVNLAMGLLSRVAPQVQMHVIGAPGQILAGLALLGLMAPPLLAAFLEALRAAWTGLPGLG